MPDTADGLRRRHIHVTVTSRGRTRSVSPHRWCISLKIMTLFHVKLFRHPNVLKSYGSGIYPRFWNHNALASQCPDIPISWHHNVLTSQCPDIAQPWHHNAHYNAMHITMYWHLNVLTSQCPDITRQCTLQCTDISMSWYHNVSTSQCPDITMHWHLNVLTSQCLDITRPWHHNVSTSKCPDNTMLVRFCLVPVFGKWSSAHKHWVVYCVDSCLAVEEWQVRSEISQIVTVWV